MAVLCDEYRPFDNGAGKDVREAGWRAMARHWLPDGPLISGLQPTSWGTQLQPYGDGGGMRVVVRPGEVWVRGHHGVVLLDKSIPVASNSSGSNRFDAVVARADFISDVVELDVVQGTSSATGPSLVQDSTKWEILLGIVTVPSSATSIIAGNVADRRRLVGYSEGTWAGQLIATTPITMVTARYRRINGLIECWFRVDTPGIIASPTFTLPYPHGHATNDALGIARVQNNGAVGQFFNYHIAIEANANTSRVHFAATNSPTATMDDTGNFGLGAGSIRAQFSYIPAQ